MGRRRRPMLGSAGLQPAADRRSANRAFIGSAPSPSPPLATPFPASAPFEFRAGALSVRRARRNHGVFRLSSTRNGFCSTADGRDTGGDRAVTSALALNALDKSGSAPALRSILGGCWQAALEQGGKPPRERRRIGQLLAFDDAGLIE